MTRAKGLVAERQAVREEIKRHAAEVDAWLAKVAELLGENNG